MNDGIRKLIERLISEGAIGMTEAASLPGTFRGGRPCHPSTLTRWCLTGVRLPDGTVLRLEHFRVAGRLMTSRAALLRFLAAQQTGPPDPPPRSPAQRDRDAAAAGLELDNLMRS